MPRGTQAAKRKSARKPRRGGRSRKQAPVGACPLTGLPHRTHAVGLWRQGVEESRQAGLPCSFALIDIDGYRRHNEELGAARADALLQGVVDRVRKSLSDSAYLGRLAGDVLGVVLPGLEVEEGLSLVERVRQEVTKSPVRVGRGVRKRQVEITLSIGLSAVSRHARTLAPLRAAAQAALWRAKALGGNRVGLPGKERMVLKTSYYPQGQLSQLKALAQRLDVKEAALLREALGDLFLKYKDRRPES